MKCVLLALVATAAAAPFKLCTINRMVVSETDKVLYADKPRNSENPMFEYNPISKLLKVVETNRCVKVVPGQNLSLRTVQCRASDIHQHWELKQNRVSSLALDACLQAKPSMPGAAVGLAACDWTSSLASGEFLAECSTVAQAYTTITSVSNQRLSEYKSNLYANTVANNVNELFVWDQANKMFKSTSAPNQCLDAYKDGAGKFQVHTWACDVNNGNQKWNYNTNTKKLEHATHAGQCLDVDPTYADHRVQMWACTPKNPHQMWNVAPYKP